VARPRALVSHGAVDSGYKINKSFADTIHQRGMTWVQNFMAGGAAYQMNYESSKGEDHVYRSGPQSPSSSIFGRRCR
jgi:hypothetical protein